MIFWTRGCSVKPSGVVVSDWFETDADNLRAALVGGALRRYRPQRQFLALLATGDKPGAIAIINQIRQKIGVMFGNPETTTGGNALKFYASVRIDIRRIGSIKDKDEVVGNETRCKVVKNKVSPPFKQVEFEIMYGEGISKMGEIIDMGVKLNIIEKAGSWFSYNSTRIGQGKESAKQYLRDNPKLAQEIEDKIRKSSATASDALAVQPEAEELADAS